MTREELCIRLSERTGSSRGVCDAVLNEFFRLVVETVSEGERLTLRGVGRFEFQCGKGKTSVRFLASDKLENTLKALLSEQRQVG